MTLLELTETIEQDPTLQGRETLRGNIVRYVNAGLRSIASRRRRPIRKGALIPYGNIFVPEEGELITIHKVWAVVDDRLVNLPYLNSESGVKQDVLAYAGPKSLCAWNLHNEDDTDGVRLYAASGYGVHQIMEDTQGIDGIRFGYEGVVFTPMSEGNPLSSIPLRNPDALGALLLIVKSYLFQDIGDIERSNVNYRLFEQRLAAETTIERTNYVVIPDSFLRGGQ